MQEHLLWDVVDALVHRQATDRTRQGAAVHWLGIDELALRKGHKASVCVLVDLQKACVVDVLKERTQAYLTEYFRQKGEPCLAHIEVFSSDLGDGFINVALTFMPNAVIVIDRFHVRRNLHKALEACRRSLRRVYHAADVLTHVRWPLLKHPATLTEAERTQLEQAFVFCPHLAQGSQLKEDFRRWSDGFICPGQAETWLNQWLDQARVLQNSHLAAFVGTVTRWKPSILNFCPHRITNGLVEGINNTITLIKRRALGSLKFEHFRLRVLTECR